MIKYYFTYEIKVDNPDSKFHNHYYYGKHITSNINDNYFGSSKMLLNYQKKYNNKGLIKTILNYYDNEEELNIAEFELIKQKKKELGNLCLNLNDGGKGSFSYINNNLTDEQKHQNAMIGGLANKKRLEDPDAAAQWREQVKQRHLNMSEKEKKEIYGKVSQSLKDYYKTEKGKIELQERNKKNKQSNIESAKKWRDEFKVLFRGYQPEHFRKYGKQKEANSLYKEIKNLEKDIQKQKIDEFFNSL